MIKTEKKSLGYTWFSDLLLGKRMNIKLVLYTISSFVNPGRAIYQKKQKKKYS